MTPIGARRGAPGEGGFTLVEIVIAVAIILALAGAAVQTLAQRPAQISSTALALAALVADARSLAAVTGAATLDGGSGATLSVRRDGDDYVVTLYAYRPIRGARNGPRIESNTPPLRTTTAIALGPAGATSQAPFAVFFSSAGHASAQPGFTVGVSAPLATEPACRAPAGIMLELSDPTRIARHTISCDEARLDLAAAATTAAPADPQRRP